ncbi:MAG: heavy metal-binding domain-containing protein [Limisphaerales bacterium]
MKTKTILIIVLVAATAGTGAWWMISHRVLSPPVVTAPAGRKILYYQSSMHPWIKSDRPGKCPICGMDLVPIYADAVGTNITDGITLNPESVTALHVQTDAVERRTLRHTLRVAGVISVNSWTTTWFAFDAYQRDLPWLKIGQTVEVTVPSLPGKIFTARIRRYGTEPYADTEFDATTDSTKVRAELSYPGIGTGDFGADRLFNNFYAEGRVLADSPEVLTVPRSAVIWPGGQPIVYVDAGGHYESRSVKLGRAGDEYWEVLGGLKEYEKVVTTGNLLIDSEAQLANGH